MQEDLQRLIEYLSEMRQHRQMDRDGLMRAVLSRFTGFTSAVGGAIVSADLASATTGGLVPRTRGVRILCNDADFMPSEVEAVVEALALAQRLGGIVATGRIFVEGRLGLVPLACLQAIPCCVLLKEVESETLQQNRQALRILAESAAASIDNQHLLSELLTLNSNLEERVDKRTTEVAGTNRRLAEKTEELESMVVALKQTESQLLQQDKLAVVGQLAACVAHEINNPCAYIQANVEMLVGYAQDIEGYLCLIREGAPRDRLREFETKHHIERQTDDLPSLLGDTADGVRRIVRIVRELRSFGRVDHEVSEVHLNELLSRTVRLLENELRHRAVVRLHQGQIPLTVANPGRLLQVFINLVMNALQAMKSSIKEENEVLITTGMGGEGGEEITVSVRDNGSGISANAIEKIFEPFYTTKDVNEGTGLGLSICRTIVENHGGKIEVESRLHSGTTFTVTLPVAKELPQSLPASVPQLKPADDGALRLLFVDDDAQVLRSYRRLFAARHDVSLADSARAALEYLEEDSSYDAIVCDIMMPNVSGPDFFRFTRDLFPQLASRFVFVTGGAFTEESTHFLEEERPPLLQKPFDRGELEALLHRIAHIENLKMVS